VHMFTHHAVILPVTTSSTACHPPLCKCHYNNSDPWLQWELVESVITLEFIQILQPINPQSPRKTPMQELKWKRTVVTLKQNI
jgi:hypothetical protein